MVIPANRLDHMVRSNPALAVALIKDLANRMLRAEDVARDAEKSSAKKPKQERNAEHPEQRPRSQSQPHSTRSSRPASIAQARGGEKGPAARRRPKAGREA